MAVLDTTKAGPYRNRCALERLRLSIVVYMRGALPTHLLPQRLALGPEIAGLLTMAGLPLLDGFFLAFLATSLWQDLGRAATFGVTAFSGAGCVVAAMQLSGSPLRRIGQVAAVYAAVAAGALTITTLRPTFQSLLPANLSLFTGVFLLGLGLWVSGLPTARKMASWVGFQAAVKVMLVASLIHGLRNGITWGVSLDGQAFAGVGVALVTGLLLTLSGVGLGLVRDRIPDPRPLNIGASGSLLIMGLSVLGWPAPTALVLAPLLGGCLWTAARVAYGRLGGKATDTATLL